MSKNVAAQTNDVARDDDRMITSRQLAERWGCSIEKIELDRYSGRGPNFVKVGRLVRYRMSDVVAYENANRVSTQVR